MATSHIRDARRERAFLYSRYHLFNAFALFGADVIALHLGAYLGALFTAWMFATGPVLWLAWALIPGWAFGALVLGLLPTWGLGPVEELRRLTGLLFIVFTGTALTLLVSGQGDAVEYATIGSGLVLSTFLIPFVRLRVKKLLVSHSLWGIPTVVYGAGRTGQRVISLLQEEKGLGYTPVAAFDDAPEMAGTSVAGVPVVGTTKDAMLVVPLAIVAMPGLDRHRLVELLEGPLSIYRTVLVIPDLFEIPSVWVRPRDLSGILGLELERNLMSPWAAALKRTVDVGVVLACAPLVLPVCLAIAAAVWLSDRSSPVFTQERLGLNGRSIRTFKFRTMVPEADVVLERHLQADTALREEWMSNFKLRRDPRITPLGRILRRFSLDELPQLLNVLRGDMSLVGPRPLPSYHAAELSPRLRTMRERVLPGLTGLWQISGRSDAGTDGMEMWDSYYVRNWSFWLDIVILVRTLRAVLRGKGAY